MTVFASLLMCYISYGQTPDKNSDKASKVDQKIRALDRIWTDAINKGDAPALDRLFADDMIVTAGNGGIRNKASEIKDAAGGGGAPDPDFVWTLPFTTEDVRVRIYKDAAVVTGRAKWGFKYKGQESIHDKRYTHLYVKQAGQWRIVAQQISSNLYRKP